MSKKQLTIVGTVVVLAIAVGIATRTGLFPAKPGVEGAVGGAKRYQAEQIHNGDVVLQDTKVQAFLQTDLFHTIATNDKLRKLMRDPHFQELAKKQSFYAVAPQVCEALKGPNTKQLFESAGYAEAAKHPQILKLLSDETARRLTLNKNFQEVMKDPQFVAALRDKQFQELVSACEAEKTHSVAALHNMEAYKNASNNMEIAKTVKSTEVQKLIVSNELQSAISEPGLLELLDNAQAMELLNNPSWVEVCKNQQLSETLTSMEMADIYAPLSELMRQGNAAETLEAISDPQMLEAMQKSEFQEIGQADALEKAVASVQQ